MNSGPGNASGCLYMKNTTIIQTYLGLLVGGDIIRNAVLKWNKLLTLLREQRVEISNIPILSLAPYLASVDMFDEIEWMR
jgi:kynureninase